jgi:hypothetical protein
LRLGKNRTLVVHSGDFLGPSRVGTTTKGAAMVRMLNTLRLDYCVLGNHEFDYGEDVLWKRLEEANFGVVLSNASHPSHPLAEPVYWPSPEEPLVALAGLVSQSVVAAFKGPAGPWKFEQPAETRRRLFPQLECAAFRVVLTHADRSEDREMRKCWPWRTLFLGGHDHDIAHVEDDGHPLVKNRSNLQTISVTLLQAGGDLAILRLYGRSYEMLKRRSDAYYHTEKADSSGPLSDEVAELNRRKRLRSGIPFYETVLPDDADELLDCIPTWDRELIRSKFASLQSPAKCVLADTALDSLDRYPTYRWCFLEEADHTLPPSGDGLAIVRAVLPSETSTPCAIATAIERIDARDVTLRHRATLFGVAIAECLRRFCQADVAIVNSGSFRADGYLPQSLTMRDLDECFLYDKPDSVAMFSLERDAFQELITHGRSRPGSGGFPQFTLADLPENKCLLKVATIRYLFFDPKCVDGYVEALAGYWMTSCTEARERLSARIEGTSGSIVQAAKEHLGTVLAADIDPSLEGEREHLGTVLAADIDASRPIPVGQACEDYVRVADAHWDKLQQLLDLERSSNREGSVRVPLPIGLAGRELRDIIRHMAANGVGAYQRYRCVADLERTLIGRSELDLPERPPYEEVMSALHGGLVLTGQLRQMLSEHRRRFEADRFYTSLRPLWEFILPTSEFDSTLDWCELEGLDANASYLVATDTPEIYLARSQNEPGHHARLVAANIGRVPWLWMMLFSEVDLESADVTFNAKTTIVRMQAGTRPVRAPIVQCSVALDRLERRRDYFVDLLDGVPLVHGAIDSFQGALRQHKEYWLHLDHEEIAVLHRFPDEWHKELGLALREIDGLCLSARRTLMYLSKAVGASPPKPDSVSPGSPEFERYLQEVCGLYLW